MWTFIKAQFLIWAKSLLFSCIFIYFILPLIILIVSNDILNMLFSVYKVPLAKNMILYGELFLTLVILHPKLKLKASLFNVYNFINGITAASAPAALYLVTLRIMNQFCLPLLMSIQLLGVILYQIFIVAFVEELWFRGILYNKLAPYLPTTINIVINSILFSLLHFNGGALKAAMAFIFSIIVLVFYCRSKNLWFCIFIHGITNTIGIIIN